GAARRNVPQPDARRRPGRQRGHQLGGQLRRHAHLPAAAEGGRPRRCLRAVRGGGRGFLAVREDRRPRDEGQNSGADVSRARESPDLTARMGAGARDAAPIPAIATIGGWVVGAVGTLVSPWVTQRYHDRRDLLAAQLARREALYSDFIGESA